MKFLLHFVPRQTLHPARGIALAPILYLLTLIGVGAGVLFSGYSQILRSGQTLSNTLNAKSDLQVIATTLATTSWLSTDQTLLCPPMVGSNSPSTPAAICSSSSSAKTIGAAFSAATAGNLPSSPNGTGAANLSSYVTSSGTPVEAGVFAAGNGYKLLDPWGHYYVYCRWENGIGSSSAFAIISGGPNGKVETKCGDTSAGGDDLMIVWSTSVTQNRAAVWQTTVSGSTITGVKFGAVGTQISITSAGNTTVPGTLNVTGASTLGAMTSTGITSSPISGASGSFTNLTIGNSGQTIVDTSGNVGIGMTPSYPLDVVGDMRTTTCLRYGGGSLGSCSSDARLKRGIQPYKPGLSVVAGLKPETFYYNGLGGNPDDGRRQIGLVAQEVEKIAPELVTNRKIKLHRDDKEPTDIKVLDYGALNYMLVNAVRELKEDNDKKAAEIAVLRRDVDALKAQGK